MMQLLKKYNHIFEYLHKSNTCNSNMKVALCFIISYEHILNKEHIWREWIEYNKDIINVYFYYKDFTKIKSEWIRSHSLPQNHIRETSYYHVIPAYISLMNYAYNNDKGNFWFCFLTDSCCPLVSPKRFRYLFFKNYNKSVISWRRAWWNPDFHKRANLRLLPPELRLANDPWFILKREDVINCMNFIQKQQNLTKTICSGGLANESLFAIILYVTKQLDNAICSVTHATDWSRMTSPTSPYLFKDVNNTDIQFIESELSKNENLLFIRKIAPEFPDDVLRRYIYNHSKKRDNMLKVNDPFILRKIIFYLFVSVLLPSLYILVEKYLE